MTDAPRHRQLAKILDALAGGVGDEALLRQAMELFAAVGPEDDADLEALRRRYVARLVDLGRDRDAAAFEVKSGAGGDSGPQRQPAGSKTTLSTPSSRASKSR